MMVTFKSRYRITALVDSRWLLIAIVRTIIAKSCSADSTSQTYRRDFNKESLQASLEQRAFFQTLISCSIFLNWIK